MGDAEAKAEISRRLRAKYRSPAQRWAVLLKAASLAGCKWEVHVEDRMLALAIFHAHRIEDDGQRRMDPRFPHMLFEERMSGAKSTVVVRNSNDYKYIRSRSDKVLAMDVHFLDVGGYLLFWSCAIDLARE